MPTLEEAIEYIRMGNREEGRQMLEEILEEEENNEEVWLWLSSVVDTDEDREICLENVLALNPDNVVAKKGLEAIQSGSFNANELLSDVLEEEEQEREAATFIDDFRLGDDELELPSSMKPGSKPKKKSKSKSGGGLNVRLIILGVLILVVILGLAGVAGFVLLSGGDGGGEETPPVGAPTEAQQPQETPTPTETPTPAPTDTPTATATSALQLPTAAPTLTPSATATTVVSPTPNN